MALSPKPRRIAFADDDADDHYIFLTALKEVDSSIEVMQFYRCQDLFEYLEANDLPHYLFLDLNVPGNEDFKCLIEMKNHKVYKDIIVIVYTTSNIPGLEKHIYDMGADGYIVKPYSICELQIILREMLLTFSNQS